jgi:hypothetical protein
MSTSHPRDGSAVPSPWTSAPDGYLWIPTQLLNTIYDSPLAIGLYTLIARRWLADGGVDGVPLSDADIARYDPQLSSRGALMRAVARLETAGWIATVRARGAKTRYMPTWGRGRGGVRPWSKAAPSLNRGRVQTIRVSRRLLDDYLGRLIPHPRVPAQVERYQTTPTIGLKDIGVYILRQHQRATPPAPALDAARLCQDTTALAVPPTREALAQAELSVQGMRRVGLLPPGPQPRPAGTDPRPTVFFVSPHMIGHMIGHMIAAPRSSGTGFGAAERAETPAGTKNANVTGMTGRQGMTLNPPTPTKEAEGGGLAMTGSIQEEQPTGEDVYYLPEKDLSRRADRPGRWRRDLMSIPVTPSAQRLQALGVRPAQCRELADVPLPTIEAALLDAQARPKIRDRAAWVVSLVRDVRDHGWDLAMRTRGAAPDNAGPSLAELQASIARARASGSWTVDADTPASATPAVPPITDDTAATLQRARASGFFGPREEPCLPPARAASMVVTQAGPAQAPRPARTETAERPPRSPARMVSAPTPAPAKTAERSLLPAAAPEPLDPGRPDWITSIDWQTLPVLVRGALRGARLVGHRVVAADSWQQRQLERYEPTLTRLVAAAGVNDQAAGVLPPPAA